MKDWTLQEFLELPISDGCPNGHPHFGSFPAWRPWHFAPRIYACHGNELGFDPPCGARWRGVPGITYDDLWFAAQSVAVFLMRGSGLSLAQVEAMRA